MVIATTRLTWPRGRVSKKQFFSKIRFALDSFNLANMAINSSDPRTSHLSFLMNQTMKTQQKIHAVPSLPPTSPISVTVSTAGLHCHDNSGIQYLWTEILTSQILNS